ncbi:Lar family restriction alleviation protein [Pseudomonas aeruginosa]|uniref:Lar family restriction alleviation protein n=1 Tax=Pseudomonas aeruginosa TaxID=287 RepID=UPI0012986870|nr:Lar family restriction alleviation protein [Pseudomonas aeruginosa]
MTELYLKPCPFCSCTRIGIHFKRAARKEGYQAMCSGCRVGQTHVLYGSPERAAEAWNTRASPEPAIAEDVRGRWESNCGSEIYLSTEDGEPGLRIGHFQGDAALAAYVVALHNTTLGLQ